ncbi:glycosyl hydrolase [candidate division KSB1 bacterium]|nr:glycosyl hydrolase [candidate division KSB1 bacterium]
MITLYWNDNNHIFYSTNYKNENLNYWWQAHGLNAIVDASIRVKNDKYFKMISDFYNGIGIANDGFINDFYDDMAWMGIALLRAYEQTNINKYLDTSTQLWDNITTGWNENNGGGIAWNKHQLTYKNTPSNATTAILSFRLYAITKDKKYFDLGEKTMNWLYDTLVDKSSGMVWDGIGRTEANLIDDNWLFTYNQGIFLGACIEFYNTSQKEIWRERAIKTADNAIIAFTGHFNVLKDEGKGDGGLFKGILIRYLKYLSDQPFLDKAKSDVYKAFIKNNSEVLWKAGKSASYPYTFNHDWTKNPAGEIDLSVQLSGVFLLEACSGIEIKKH